MSVSLTVMTFNLHEDQPPESPNSWDKRKELCLRVITSYYPMILCTQQGVKSQLDYLQQGLPGVEPPGFSFEIVNTNMDEFSPRARRRSALLTWQHIASLPPSLPVVYCGGFNTQKESTTGRFLLGRSREHGVVGDLRDAWPNARVRKNLSLIRTYHGFKGDKQGAVEFLKLIFRALCLCWDRQTQDLHIDWILFRGRSLIPVSCEVVNDNSEGSYPSSHFPLFAEFMLPRTVRMLEPPTQEEN
uniref:Endonuclease/exonuclease/phosphatase domain-containing protein n=1 Tax=Cannabis sativa TaxID=3483 RepID=A0A803QB01_CANSA